MIPKDSYVQGDCSHVQRIERLEISTNEIAGHVAEIRFIVSERLPRDHLIRLDRLEQAEAERVITAAHVKAWTIASVLGAIGAILVSLWHKLGGA